MKCSRCRMDSVVERPDIGSLCKNCFSDMIEKRIRKGIRVKKLIKKGDRLLICCNLSEIMIKSIFKGLPIEIFYKKMSKDKIKERNIKGFIKKNRINKVIVQWTIDDEIDSFLKAMFLKKNGDKMDCLSILSSITDAEASLLAKIKGCKFKENKKDAGIKDMIDSMEKKYPETRFSLAKSINQMKQIIHA